MTGSWAESGHREDPDTTVRERGSSTLRLPRLAALGALGFSVVLPLVELGRIGVFEPAGDFWIAVVATVAYLPLHLRHVSAGLRGSRPRGAGWTLAAMVVVMAAAGLLVGSGWALMFASLVVSVLLVVRPPLSIVLVGVILAGTFVVGGLGTDESAWVGRGLVLTLAVVLRGVAMFVVIWFVTATRQLAAARAELSRDAVMSERWHLEDDLRGSLGDHVEALVTKTLRADALADTQDDRCSTALTEVVVASRDLLAKVRRVVDGYRRSRTAGAAQHTMIGASDGPVNDLFAVVRRSRVLLIGVRLPMLGFLVVAASGGLGYLASGAPLIAVPAVLALGALELRLALAIARGVSPSWGRLTCAALVVLLLAPWVAIGPHWVNSVWWAAAAAAMVFGRPTRLAAFILPGVLLAVVGVRYQLDPGTPTVTVLWLAAYSFLISVMGVGTLYGSALLTRVVDELYETRFALAAQAARGERDRLSRDLHDMLGQSLSAISLKGDLALRLLARRPELAAEQVRGLAELATRLADEVREVTQGDREVSLAAEATGAVELLRAAGVDVDVDLPTQALAPPADAVLGWAVREGVTNVLRHSAAKWCSIRATHDSEGRVQLDIVNDGVTAPSTQSAQSGNGLDGLAARARAPHGSVDAGHIGGDRFRLRVTVRGGSR